MVVAMTTSILSDALGIDIVYPTAMTNGTNLLVSENAKYEVINGKTVSVYDTAVSSEMIWKTIVVSLIFTAIYMTITYINFKKKDRD
jgi:ABC-type transport system involved in multi-copper enzyme maturation permease subunit